MTRLILFFFASSLLAQTINSARPRLILNGEAPGGGTRLAALRAKRDAGTPPKDWSGMLTEAGSYTGDSGTCDGTVGNRANCSANFSLSSAAQYPPMYGLLAQVYADQAGVNNTAAKWGYRCANALDRSVDFYAPNSVITDVTNSTNPVFTTSGSHNLAVGHYVGILGADGAWASINSGYSIATGVPSKGLGYWIVDTVPTSTTFTLRRLSVNGQAVPDTTALGAFTGQSNPRVYGGAGKPFYTAMYYSDGNSWRQVYGGLLYAGDWCSDYQTATQREKWVDFIGHRANYFSQPENWEGGGQIQWAGNNRYGIMRGALLANITLSGDFANAQTNFNTLMAEWSEDIIPMLTTGLLYNGAAIEGPEYSPDTIKMILQSIDAIVYGTDAGTAFYANFPNWHKQVAQYTIHSTSPPKRDAAGNTISITNTFHQTPSVTYLDRLPTPMADQELAFRNTFGKPDFREGMLFVFDKLAANGDTTWAEYMQHWLKNVVPVFQQGGSEPQFGYVMDAALWSETYTATDYTASLTDLGFLAGGTSSTSAIGWGEKLARSDWTDNATHMIFRCGLTGHQHSHSDDGSYQIFRKGRWLSAEVVGYANIWTSPYLHNVVMPNGWMSSNLNYGLGATYTPECRFERNAETSTYSYAWMRNLASTYNGSQVTDITRHDRTFFYARPDMLFVYDDIAYSSASPTRWLQQSSELPSVSTNTITHAKEAQRLSTKILTPTPAAIRGIDLRPLRVSKITRANPARMLIETPMGLTTSNRIKLYGGTGDWAAANGYQTLVTSGLPTNETYPIQRIISGLDTSGYSTDYMQTQAMTWRYAIYVTAVTKGTTTTVTVPGNGLFYAGGADPDRIEIEGCTGDFAGLNGTWTPASLINTAVFTLNINSSAWSGTMAANTCTAMPILRYAGGYYAAEVVTPATTADRILACVEAHNDSAAESTKTLLTASNAVAGECGDTVVAFPTTSTPTLPITYTFSNAASVKHRVVNMGASTNYHVTVSGADVTVAAATGSGDTTSSAEGVLAFSTTGSGITLDITTTTLPDATQGTAYSQQVSCIGGTAPRALTLQTGTLPTGLSISASGLISGTPTGTGTSNFTIRCTDAVPATDDQALSIVVNAAGSSVTFSTTTLADGEEDQAYAGGPLSCSGGTGPYTYALISGALPTGVSLNTDGTFGGTPTTAGDFTASYRCTDSLSATADSTPITITVNAGTPPFPTMTWPNPVVLINRGSAISETPDVADGTSPFTFALTSGSLPTGASLNASTGAITGTLTQIGDFLACITVTDSAVPALTDQKCITVRVLETGSGLTSAVYASSSSALVWFGANGLDANTTCTALLRGSDQVAVGTQVIAAGPANRPAIFTGLTANTLYSAQINCGGTATSQSFTTAASATSSASFLYQVAAASVAGTTHLRLRYGGTSALGSTSSVTACSGGVCSITLTRDGGPLWIADDRCSDDACNTVLASHPARPYMIE